MFYIVEPAKVTQQAILGRAWMQKCKCSIDWEMNTISVTHNGCQISLPLAELNNKPLVDLTTALLPLSKSERKLYLNGTHDHKASTSCTPQFQNPLPTLPKLGVTPSSKQVYTAYPTQTNKLANQRTKMVWIPKNLLLAQSYYIGNKIVWIPKRKHSHQL